MYVSLGIFTQYRRELMGVATVLILLCHSLLPPAIHCPNDILRWIIITGNRGVDIFLFLSGLGMYHSLRKMTKWNRGRGNSVVCKKIQAHFTTLSTHLLPLLPGIGLCKRRTFFHFYIFIPPFHIELLVGAQRFLVYRHVDSAIFLNSLLCPNNR